MAIMDIGFLRGILWKVVAVGVARKRSPYREPISSHGTMIHPPWQRWVKAEARAVRAEPEQIPTSPVLLPRSVMGLSSALLGPGDAIEDGLAKALVTPP
jgi:hypothetical protein